MMILATTILIWAGGPGSGCQGPNCGRKASRVFRIKLKQDEKELKEGSSEFKRVPLTSLRGLPSYRSKSLQPLSDVSHSTVDRRARAMLNGKSFSPIMLWPSGDRYHVQDGMHRLAAFKKAFPNETHIRALVLTGKGKKESRLYKKISENNPYI